MKWLGGALIFAAVFCARPLPAQAELTVSLKTADREVEFGRPFVLELEIIRSAELVLESWSDDRLAPLVLKLLSFETTTEEGRITERRRYEARLFRRGAATLRPTAWRGFPRAGGEVVSAECPPLLLFVSSSLDLADPGPVESIDVLLEEPRSWSEAIGPALWWLGILGACAALGAGVSVLYRRHSGPKVLGPLESARREIQQGKAAGASAISAGADILREYLLREFSIPAPVLTTRECLRALSADGRFAASQVEGLRHHLEAADAGKFEGSGSTDAGADWSRIEEALNDLHATISEEASPPLPEAST